MGVYIEGIKMPVLEDQSWDIRHGADGKWYVVDTNAETSDGEWHEIIPVQPHGRLIDADALDDLLMNFADNKYTPKVFASWLSYEENAPTIIPAESAKEGET